ncbi:MAG: hypothetical protein CME32_27175 [Gimesia sp.]|nr:hypothetical protein [Gimesia sp.]
MMRDSTTHKQVAQTFQETFAIQPPFDINAKALSPKGSFTLSYIDACVVDTGKNVRSKPKLYLIFHKLILLNVV